MENELTLAIAGLKEPSPGLIMNVLLQKHMLHAKGYFFPQLKNAQVISSGLRT